jgi:beta-mannosidase
MERLLTDWTGHDITRLTVEEYVYWTGLLQAEGLTEYIDNFRRRSATTGAAVFWMFNDCWPAVRSWSVVDDRGRRNPSFAPVRRAFAPVRVSVVPAGAASGRSEAEPAVKRHRLETGPAPGGARVWGCNDTPRPVTLTLDAGTAGLRGGLAWTSRPVVLPAHTATALADIPRPSGDPLAHAYVARLRAGTAEVSRNRLFAAPFATLDWAPSTVDVRPAGPGRFEPLPDNLFDLFPGVPTVLDWPWPPRILFTGNLTRTGDLPAPGPRPASAAGSARRGTQSPGS